MTNRTLTIIKPECVKARNAGNIIARIENAGFELIAMKKVRLDRAEAEEFYSIHQDKPFFASLIEYITSGSVIVMVLGKENCVEEFRKFIGATDPQKAEPGTIRADFGTNITYNCIHASDSDENAKLESSFFFSAREII